MSDVLGVLAARSLGVPAAVRPAIRPLYDGDGGLLSARGDGVLDEEPGPAFDGEDVVVDADGAREAERGGPRAAALPAALPAAAARAADDVTDAVVRGAGAPVVGRPARDARDAAASPRAEDRTPAAYGVRAASGAPPDAATAEAVGVEPGGLGLAEPGRAAGAATVERRVDQPTAARTEPRRDSADRAPETPHATEPRRVLPEPPASPAPTPARAAEPATLLVPAPPLVPVAVQPRRPAAGTAQAVPEARDTGDDGTRVVHVSIGRIDVRAVPAPAPERRPRTAPRRPAVGLEEYLRTRDGRR